MRMDGDRVGSWVFMEGTTTTVHVKSIYFTELAPVTWDSWEQNAVENKPADAQGRVHDSQLADFLLSWKRSVCSLKLSTNWIWFFHHMKAQKTY